MATHLAPALPFFIIKSLFGAESPFFFFFCVDSVLLPRLALWLWHVLRGLLGLGLRARVYDPGFVP